MRVMNAVRVISSPDSDSVDSKKTNVSSVSDCSVSTSTTISALLLVMFLRMAISVGMMVVLNSSLVALKDSCINTTGVAGGIVVAGVAGGIVVAGVAGGIVVAGVAGGIVVAGVAGGIVVAGVGVSVGSTVALVVIEAVAIAVVVGTTADMYGIK